MSSEQHYAMHFFLIFLLVCLGAPASEGMISAFCVLLLKFLIQLLTANSGVFLVLLIRQYAN